jgi:hypothetical protein
LRVHADVQNTALAALLVSSDPALYTSYPGGGSPLDDQAAAGVLMWVPMSLAGGCVRMARPHLNMSPRSHRLHQSERAIPPARLAANALIVETTL